MATSEEDRLQRMRRLIDHVVRHPDSKDARIFVERLRAKRKQMTQKANANFNPKVTLAVKSCESLDMQPVDPTLFIEEMLAENVASTNMKVVQMSDDPDTGRLESAICVPREVAAKMAPAANTQRVSVVEALVTRLAEHPDQPVQLSNAEAEYVRTGVEPTDKDGGSGSITRMQHMLAMLKADLQARIRKNPESAKNFAKAAKSFGLDLSAKGSGAGAGAGAGAGEDPSSPLRTLRSRDDLERDALKATDQLMAKVAAALHVKADAEPDTTTINMLSSADNARAPSAFNSQVDLPASRSELDKLLQDDTPVVLEGGAKGFMTVEEATIMLMQLVSSDRGSLKFDMVKTLHSTRELTDVWKVISMAGSHSVDDALEDRDLDDAISDRIAFFSACAAMWSKVDSPVRYSLAACVASLEPFRSALGTFWQNVTAMQTRGTKSFQNLRDTYGGFAQRLAQDLQEVWTHVLHPEGSRDVYFVDPFSARIVSKYTGAPMRSGDGIKAADLAADVVAFLDKQGDDVKAALATCKEAIAHFASEERKQLLWIRTFAKRLALLVLTSILGFEVSVVEAVHIALRPWVAIFFQEVLSMVKTAGTEESLELKADAAEAPPFDLAKVQRAIAALGSVTKPPVQLIHRFIQQRAVQVIHVNRILDLFRVKVMEVLKGVQLNMPGGTPLRFADLIGAFMQRDKDMQKRLSLSAARELMMGATKALAAQFNALNHPSYDPSARLAAAASGSASGAQDVAGLLDGFKLQLRAVPAPDNAKERENALLVQKQFDAFNAALEALACATAYEVSATQKFIRLPPAEDARKIVLVAQLPRVGFPEYEEDSGDMTMPDHMARPLYVVEVEEGDTELEVSGWDVAEQTSKATHLPLRIAAKLLLLLRAGFVNVDKQNKNSWKTGGGGKVSLINAYKEKKEGHKIVKACLRTITSLLYSTLDSASPDSVTDVLKAIKIVLQEEVFMSKFFPKVGATSEVLDGWWGQVQGKVLPTKVFEKEASVADWAALLPFLPMTNKGKDVRSGVEQWTAPWLAVQALDSGHSLTKQAQAFVWAQKFKMEHPLNMTMQAFVHELSIAFFGGAEGARKRQEAMIAGGDEGAEAQKVNQEIASLMRPATAVTEAVLIFSAGLKMGNTFWSPTDMSFEFDGDVLERATVDNDVMLQLITRRREGLLLSVASAVSQLTLEKAMALTEKIVNTQLRDTIQANLETVQFTKIRPSQGVWDATLVYMFSAQDLSDATSIALQWSEVDKAPSSVIPDAVKEALNMVRNDAVDMWTDDKTVEGLDTVREAIYSARNKIQAIWMEAGHATRSEFNTNRNLYSFPQNLAQKSVMQAFVKQFVTADAWAKLEESDGAALKPLLSGLHEDLMAEWKGTYMRHALVQDSWSEQALQFRVALEDTFVRQRPDRVGGEVDLQINLGEKVVTTKVNLGDPGSFPQVHLCITACALLGAQQFLDRMQAAMPLTLAFCMILASANREASTAAENNVSFSPDQKEKLITTLGKPFVEFPVETQARFVNALFRHTDAGWLKTKSWTEELRDEVFNNDAFGEVVDLSNIRSMTPLAQATHAFLRSFTSITTKSWAFKTTTKSPWLSILTNASEVLEKLLKKKKGGFFFDLLFPLQWKEEISTGTLSHCAKNIPMLVLLFFKSQCSSLGSSKFKTYVNAEAVAAFVDPGTCKEATEECLDWWKQNKLGGSFLGNMGRLVW